MNQHRDEDQLCAWEKVAFSGLIFTTAYAVFITAKITLIFIHTIYKPAWKPTYIWCFLFSKKEPVVLYQLCDAPYNLFFFFQVKYFLTRGSTICKTKSIHVIRGNILFSTCTSVYFQTRFGGSLNFGKTNSAFFFLSLPIFTSQKFSTDIIYKNQTIIVWYQNITSKFHYIPFH